jgi:hypothetical protein
MCTADQFCRGTLGGASPNLRGRDWRHASALPHPTEERVSGSSHGSALSRFAGSSGRVRRRDRECRNGRRGALTPADDESVAMRRANGRLPGLGRRAWASSFAGASPMSAGAFAYRRIPTVWGRFGLLADRRPRPGEPGEGSATKANGAMQPRMHCRRWTIRDPACRGSSDARSRPGEAVVSPSAADAVGRRPKRWRGARSPHARLAPKAAVRDTQEHGRGVHKPRLCWDEARECAANPRREGDRDRYLLRPPPRPRRPRPEGVGDVARERGDREAGNRRP